MSTASDDNPNSANEKRDRPGEEMADDAHIWDVYYEAAKQSDEETVKGWKSGLDTLALFAGLFSTVTTAFIIESQKLMQPDYGALTFLALTTNASYAASTKTAFRVAPSDRAVNCLWLVSLVLSLCAALVAILGKDWIAAYRVPDRPNRREWAELRQFRFDGVTHWYMPTIIAVAPLLLHVSLLLFAFGLAVSFMAVDTFTAILIASLAAVIWVLYAVTALTPVFSSSSPFRSPLTSVLRRMLRTCLSRWLKPSDDGWHDLRTKPSGLTLSSAMVWLRFSGASDVFRLVLTALGDIERGRIVVERLVWSPPSRASALLLQQIKAHVEQAASQESDSRGYTELGTLLRVGLHTHSVLELRAGPYTPSEIELREAIGKLAQRVIDGSGETYDSDPLTEDGFVALHVIHADREAVLRVCERVPLHARTLEYVMRHMPYPLGIHGGLRVLEARISFRSGAASWEHFAEEAVHVLSYVLSYQPDYYDLDSFGLAMERLRLILEHRSVTALDAKIAFNLLLRLALSPEGFSPGRYADFVSVLASGAFIWKIVWDDHEWTGSEVIRTVEILTHSCLDLLDLQLAIAFERLLSPHMTWHQLQDGAAAEQCCAFLEHAFRQAGNDRNVARNVRSIAVAGHVLSKSTLAVLNVGADPISLLQALIAIVTFLTNPRHPAHAVRPLLDSLLSSSATLKDGTRCSWALVDDLPKTVVDALTNSGRGWFKGDLICDLLTVLRTLKERHPDQSDWKQLAENIYIATSPVNLLTFFQNGDRLHAQLPDFYATMGFRVPGPAVLNPTTARGPSGHVAITIESSNSAAADVPP